MPALLAVAIIFIVALFGSAHAQQAGTTFRDCENCPEMVVIPKGRFIIGTPRGEDERKGTAPTNLYRSEPMTEITLAHNFAFGKFHITRGQFAEFAKDTNWDFPDNRGCWDSYGLPLAKTDDPRRSFGRNNPHLDYSFEHPGYEQDDQHPVVCVAWIDIRAYLAWLSRKAGHTYRLPSEAEWEYVARAGTTTAHYWGDEDAQACKYGNVADLTRAKKYELDPSPQQIFQCEDGFPDTSPVGSFPPNKFGVYDMVGNVWQVTEDCFEYTIDNIPRDGSPRVSDPSKVRDKSFRISDPTVGPYDRCDLHTARGGSFDIFPYAVRSGYRSRFEIWRADSGAGRFSYEGFRVARSLD
jgi:formylglycine-generating enzyme required for sulfatase activity